MEDSYTVHRRRKAAARKREKTPEPTRRRHDDDHDETEEDDDRRARMERMVQETELLEVQADNEKRNEKSRETSPEKTTTTPIREERNHRVHKRPVTPDVPGETDENVEIVDGKLCVEVSKRSEKKERDNVEEKMTSGEKKRTSGEEKRTSGEEKRTSGEGKRISGEEKRTSGDASPEVEYRRDEATPRKSRKDGTGSSARSPGKRRSAKESSPEVREKSVVEGFKNEETKNASSKRLDETREGVDDHAGKTSTRNLEAMIRDENRLREAGESARSALRSPSRKNLKNDETINKEKVETTKSRNNETRGFSSIKRIGKDTRTGYTTDSSDNEETLERKLRRKKSPETGRSKIGSKKSASRSRPTTDTDGDPEERDSRRRNEKKATSSRRRASTETDEDTKDRESAKRDFPRPPPRQTDKKQEKMKSTIATDDTVSTISKSDTFPPDNIGNDRSPKQLGRSYTMDIKKQIIPLSDDSLIEDFERAKLDYMKRERSILDPDPLDDYVDPKIEIAFRRRKMSIAKEEAKAIPVLQPREKKSWFAWIPFFGKRNKEKIDQEITEETELLKIKKDRTSDEKNIKNEIPEKKTSIVLFIRKFGDCAGEFRAFAEQNPREIRRIRVLKNRCIAELLVAMIYCGLGAFVFRFTEGAFETFYKCGVKRVKRDFLDSLWNFSHNMREEDWKSMARRKLMEFEEQLHTAHEAGVHSYSGQKSWSFLNAVLYCLTVITTIGYGHISPSTTTGRAITIVYAIFGIPMFLIILADFGKLFTRGIKFLWAFVRRVYYTGSCRRVRRTVPVQEVMKGVQLVYDLATFRRPSQMNPEDIEEMEKQQNQTQTVLNLDGNAPASAQPDTPGTPALSTFAIDDEFNLPISVAIVILLAYIFVGATVYNFWEQWGFFESFYFVFISMSTIGFGDYVPKHPIYMMLSIVYLVFGLALTSMCINVVQVMLSDSFRQASQKIGATIGFEVAEEDDSANPEAPAQPVEVADVHPTIKESESEEQVAPKAKQEDLEL